MTNKKPEMERVFGGHDVKNKKTYEHEDEGLIDRNRIKTLHEAIKNATNPEDKIKLVMELRSLMNNIDRS